MAYVESTIGDIEVAHRLAHAVLGQSLDELPPQTRRLLTAVHRLRHGRGASGTRSRSTW